MLKFILLLLLSLCFSLHFNTSYVEVYLFRKISVSIKSSDFNTSYVEVYPISLGFPLIHIPISIHLMLKFISIQLFPAAMDAIISIHLMLKFIGDEIAKWNKEVLFQYILC